MPLRPPTACRQCGKACGEGSKRGFCRLCLPTVQPVKSNTYAYRNDDKWHKFYHSKPWFDFRATVIMQNPICMRLFAPGQQCREPAKVVHHLISPRQVAGMALAPQNVVATCSGCHAGGKPGELQGRCYVPTKWFGEQFVHVDSFGQAVLPAITSSMDNWLRSLSKPTA
jgi:5-methylcytosine-specific restriction endonuclease McrA